MDEVGVKSSRFGLVSLKRRGWWNPFRLVPDWPHFVVGASNGLPSVPRLDGLGQLVVLRRDRISGGLVSQTWLGVSSRAWWW